MFCDAITHAIVIINSPKYAGCRTIRYVPFATTSRIAGIIAKFLPKNRNDISVNIPPKINEISEYKFHKFIGCDSLKITPPNINEGKLINIDFVEPNFIKDFREIINIPTVIFKTVVEIRAGECIKCS